MNMPTSDANPYKPPAELRDVSSGFRRPLPNLSSRHRLPLICLGAGSGGFAGFLIAAFLFDRPYFAIAHNIDFAFIVVGGFCGVLWSTIVSKTLKTATVLRRR